MTRTEIENQADELIESWINGNRTDVLDAITETEQDYALGGAELLERLALLAQIMWYASCMKEQQPNLAEDFCDSLVRRAAVGVIGKGEIG